MTVGVDSVSDLSEDHEVFSITLMRHVKAPGTHVIQLVDATLALDGNKDAVMFWTTIIVSNCQNATLASADEPPRALTAHHDHVIDRPHFKLLPRPAYGRCYSLYFVQFHYPFHLLALIWEDPERIFSNPCGRRVVPVLRRNRQVLAPPVRADSNYDAGRS